MRKVNAQGKCAGAPAKAGVREEKKENRVPQYRKVAATE